LTVIVALVSPFDYENAIVWKTRVETIKAMDFLVLESFAKGKN
jgi:hypothetical protein